MSASLDLLSLPGLTNGTQLATAPCSPLDITLDLGAFIQAHTSTPSTGSGSSGACGSSCAALPDPQGFVMLQQLTVPRTMTQVGCSRQSVAVWLPECLTLRALWCCSS